MGEQATDKQEDATEKAQDRTGLDAKFDAQKQPAPPENPEIVRLNAAIGSCEISIDHLRERVSVIEARLATPQATPDPMAGMNNLQKAQYNAEQKKLAKAAEAKEKADAASANPAPPPPAPTKKPAKKRGRPKKT